MGCQVPPAFMTCKCKTISALVVTLSIYFKNQTKDEMYRDRRREWLRLRELCLRDLERELKKNHDYSDQFIFQHTFLKSEFTANIQSITKVALQINITGEDSLFF